MDPLVRKLFEAAIQRSLDSGIVKNAIFLAERLHDAAPSEYSLNIRARCYYRNGEIKRTAHLLENTESEENRYLYALCCIELGQYLDAEAALLSEGGGRGFNIFKGVMQEGISSNVPNGANGLYLLGVLYRRSGQEGKATFFFERALEADPFLWVAYEGLCQLGTSPVPEESIAVPSDREEYLKKLGVCGNVTHRDVDSGLSRQEDFSLPMHSGLDAENSFSWDCNTPSPAAPPRAAPNPAAAPRRRARESARMGGRLVQPSGRPLRRSARLSFGESQVDDPLSDPTMETPKPPSFCADEDMHDATTPTPTPAPGPAVTPSAQLPPPVAPSGSSRRGDAFMADADDHDHAGLATPMVTPAPLRRGRSAGSPSHTPTGPQTPVETPTQPPSHTQPQTPGASMAHSLQTPAQGRGSRTSPARGASAGRRSQSRSRSPSRSPHRRRGRLRGTGDDPTDARPDDASVLPSASGPSGPVPQLSFSTPSAFVTPSPHTRAVTSAAMSSAISTPGPGEGGPLGKGSLYTGRSLASTCTPAAGARDDAFGFSTMKKGIGHSILSGEVINAALPQWVRALDAAVSLLQLLAAPLYHLADHRCALTINALARLPVPLRKSAYAHWCAAMSRLESAEYTAAACSFESMRRADPTRLEGTDVYSTVLWHLRDETTLCALAQEVMEQDPRSPQALCVTGNCFSLQQEHESATKFFRRATQVDPYFTYGYTLAGHECVSSESWDEAFKYYRHAIACDPRHFLAWYGLGVVYWKQEKCELAEANFRRALQIHPRSSVLCCYLGIVLHDMQRVEEALVETDKAIRIDPRNGLALFRRAKVLLDLDRVKEARAVLEELTTVAPREAQVYSLLAMVEKKLGNTVSATVSCAKAMDLEPDDGQVSKTARLPILEDSLQDDDRSGPQWTVF